MPQSYTPGPQGQNERISTTAWNRLRDAVAQLTRLTVAAPITINWVRGAPVIGMVTPQNKFGINTTAIGARAGKVPGHGMIQPYVFGGTKFVTEGIPVKVWNWTGTPITSTPVWLQYQTVDGSLFLVGKDCSGVAP